MTPFWIGAIVLFWAGVVAMVAYEGAKNAPAGYALHDAVQNAAIMLGVVSFLVGSIGLVEWLERTP